MKIFSFFFLSYPDLPASYDGPAWTVCPNELFDRERGRQLYEEWLDQLVATEALGFDGVGLNEHHQTPYSGMPSPNLIASAVIQRTSTAKICVLGNALPLYHPLRVAEEYAMLDLMSNGRLLAGMVPGDQPGYYSYGINPTEARGRFAEALDLILQAWTRPGPFEFSGDYYNLQYVNPWPLPLQRPHPPIWIPGIGSPETQRLVAERGFHYASLPFFPRAMVNENFRNFRKTWTEAGNAPDPDHAGIVIPVYVAESDEAARSEFEQHFWYFKNTLQNGAQTFAPGYTKATGLMQLMKKLEGAPSGSTWEEVAGPAGSMAVGSPRTVIEDLSARIRETGVGNLFVLLSLGSMPHQLVMKNHHIFAEEVMPALRAAFPEGGAWQDADLVTA